MVQPLPIESAAILSIPDGERVSALALNPSYSSPKLDTSILPKIEQAISEIEQNGECGFVFLNLQTGRGIAYRADARPYIASASKAPVVLYALQQAEAQQQEIPEWERQEMEAALKHSDNDAFDAFGFNYMNGEYASWLAAYDVDYNAEYGLYLYASARNMAAIWNDIDAYLQTNTENARWFADCLANTNRSFIRDGISETEAKTWNKGGWIASEGMSSTSDAGIIELDGSRYLMAIVTGQPNSVDAQERVATLARLLFAERNRLA